MVRLTAVFPNAIPPESTGDTKKSCFLGGLCGPLKAALAWELCLNGRGNIGFQDLKFVAQRIEQLDNQAISDDLEPHGSHYHRTL